MKELSDRLMGYLKSWHQTTLADKEAQGCTVDLSFDEFLSLFDKRQLASLEKSIDANRIRYSQAVDNPFAYVATWKSYAACSTRHYDINTATICSRNKSSRINLPQPGDTLRPSHCANISASMTGKEKTPEHRENISQSTKGVKKAAWTPERRLAKSIQRKAEEAAKKEKNNV